MLLTSPESIGLSSKADIHVAADGQISHSASDSINLSAQHNLRAQAQQKISLFAAQKGISAIAAKGNIALQAQGDGIEAIARKVIQIISTEDRIEINSPKEISLTAGGSQILLGGQGVLIKTGGKFEVKAGQHVFSGGRKVAMDIPLMPNEIRKQLLLQYHDEEPVKGSNFTLKYADGKRYSGITNDKGIADITDAPEGEAEVIFGEDNRAYKVVALAENNTEFKDEWADSDFEKSYNQALKESK